MFYLFTFFVSNLRSVHLRTEQAPYSITPPTHLHADLDAYISRYGGYTKLRRLDWVAQRCPDLAPDCYRAALTLLRQGINTQSYRDISARAVQLMGPEYAEDTEWADQVCVCVCVLACLSVRAGVFLLQAVAGALIFRLTDRRR